MKNLSILVLCLFVLNSCEKETSVNYIIDNQAFEVISVNGNDIVHSTSINLTVPSGEQKKVSSWSKRGKETDYFDPKTMFGEDLTITNSSEDTLLKDYKLISNWTSNIDNQRTVATHEYVLVITDSDF